MYAANAPGAPSKDVVRAKLAQHFPRTHFKLPSLRTPKEDSPSFVASADEATAMAVKKLGGGAFFGRVAVRTAQEQSGRYQGRILGHTSEHTVQQLSPFVAVIHRTDALGDSPHPIGKAIRINYSSNVAYVEASTVRSPKARDR